MWRRWFVGMLLTLVGAFLLSTPAHAIRPAADEPGDPTIYFFWGEGCPHCAAAKPFLAGLQEQYPQLEVQDYEVYNDLENREIFLAMAEKNGIEASGVPTFFLGEDVWVGFIENPIGVEIEQAVGGVRGSSWTPVPASSRPPSPSRRRSPRPNRNRPPRRCRRPTASSPCRSSARWTRRTSRWR